jgi:hypothetical protein
MNMDTDSLDFTSLPQFLPEADTIKCQLQAMNAKELQALWRCNDSIAALNLERLRGMDLQKNLTPAILAYEGLQYRYMAPGVFERGTMPISTNIYAFSLVSMDCFEPLTVLCPTAWKCRRNYRLLVLKTSMIIGVTDWRNNLQPRPT